MEASWNAPGKPVQKETSPQDEDIQPELDIMRTMVDVRKKMRITQEELAFRAGITQSDVSRLERCRRNPSLNVLKKLAEGMDMTLKIMFIPKPPKERKT